MRLAKHSRHYTQPLLYLAVRNYLTDYAINAKTGINNAIQFLRQTREAEWLFGSEIDSFVQEIYSKSIKLQSLKKIQEQAQTISHKLARNQDAEMYELSEGIGVTANKLAHEKFTPYLKLVSEPPA